MNKEIKARYTIANITTTDYEFAKKIKTDIKKMGLTHEVIYRRGFDEFIQDVADGIISSDGGK